MSSRQVIHATVAELGYSRNNTVKGQTAKALLALVEAGSKGVTALEAATWAYRLTEWWAFPLVRCPVVEAATSH